MKPEDLGAYYESLLDKEARKEGGVHYTPPFIVDYMVEHSLSALLKGKSVDEVAAIKIVDPACGAGVFLLGTYQYLLDWHEKHIGSLTLEQRRKILTDNIFGVDIDPLAVEITKYCLSMKCLEGKDFTLDFDENIQCGNSLLDTDFCWQKEFSHVFKQGGFDIVIGNPPYIQLQKRGGTLAKKYESSNYTTFARTGDIYMLFYERGWRLLADGGHLCYITSNKWMRAGYGEKLRKFLNKKTNPKILLDFAGTKIFESSTVDVNILLFAKEANRHQTAVRIIHNVAELKEMTQSRNRKIALSDSAQSTDCGSAGHTQAFSSSPWVIMSPTALQIKKKIESVGMPLKKWKVKINFGIKTGCNEAFIIDGAKKAELIAADPKSAEIIKPILRGRDIQRYGYEFADLYLITTFPALNINIEKYPAVKKHLLSFGKHRLEQSGKKGARKKSNNKWFETQDTIAYWQDFSKPKIVYPDIMGMPHDENAWNDYPYIFYDTENFFVEATNFLMTGKDIDLIYIFMASDVGFYVYSLFYSGPLLGKTGFRYKKAYLNELPVPRFDNRTAAKLRAAMADIDSNRESVEKIIENFCGFDEQEIRAIRMYKKHLLSNDKIALVEEDGT